MLFRSGLQTPSEAGHAAGAVEADHVVGESSDESDNDDDLEDQTGHGDVDARVVGIVGFFCGDGTTGSLQDQADDVGGDEDPVEELGLEAGEVWGEVDDGLGQGDIDGRGVEDGGDGEADCELGQQGSSLHGREVSEAHQSGS